MGIMFPRQISPLRRVGLPKKPAENVAIGADSRVVLAVARNSRSALLIRPVDPQGEEGGVERKVSPTRQVTIPAAVMDQVGWQIGEWVYVSEASRRRGLRVTSTKTTTLTEETP